MLDGKAPHVKPDYQALIKAGEFSITVNFLDTIRGEFDQFDAETCQIIKDRADQVQDREMYKDRGFNRDVYETATRFILLSDKRLDAINEASLADEVGELEQQIKELKTRLDEKKAMIKDKGIEQVTGNLFVLSVTHNQRRTLDNKAVRDTLGAVWCANHEKVVNVTTIKTTPRLAA